MEGVVWAALITAIGAVVLAIGGWYVNRTHGLPSGVANAIRSELNTMIESQKGKIARLERDLETEKVGRQEDKEECLRQIHLLGDGLVERDVVIARLHARLGLEMPPVSDPKGG